MSRSFLRHQIFVFLMLFVSFFLLLQPHQRVASQWVDDPTEYPNFVEAFDIELTLDISTDYGTDGVTVKNFKGPDAAIYVKGFILPGQTLRFVGFTAMYIELDIFVFPGAKIIFSNINTTQYGISFPAKKAYKRAEGTCDNKEFLDSLWTAKGEGGKPMAKFLDATKPALIEVKNCILNGTGSKHDWRWAQLHVGAVAMCGFLFQDTGVPQNMRPSTFVHNRPNGLLDVRITDSFILQVADWRGFGTHSGITIYPNMATIDEKLWRNFVANLSSIVIEDNRRVAVAVSAWERSQGVPERSVPTARAIEIGKSNRWSGFDNYGTAMRTPTTAWSALHPGSIHIRRNRIVVDVVYECIGIHLARLGAGPLEPLFAERDAFWRGEPKRNLFNISIEENQIQLSGHERVTGVVLDTALPYPADIRFVGTKRKSSSNNNNNALNKQEENDVTLTLIDAKTWHAPGAKGSEQRIAALRLVASQNWLPRYVADPLLSSSNIITIKPRENEVSAESLYPRSKLSPPDLLVSSLRVTGTSLCRTDPASMRFISLENNHNNRISISGIDCHFSQKDSTVLDQNFRPTVTRTNWESAFLWFRNLYSSCSTDDVWNMELLCTWSGSAHSLVVRDIVYTCFLNATKATIDFWTIQRILFLSAAAEEGETPQSGSNRSKNHEIIAGAAGSMVVRNLNIEMRSSTDCDVMEMGQINVPQGMLIERINSTVYEADEFLFLGSSNSDRSRAGTFGQNVTVRNIRQTAFGRPTWRNEEPDEVTFKSKFDGVVVRYSLVGTLLVEDCQFDFPARFKGGSVIRAINTTTIIIRRVKARAVVETNSGFFSAANEYSHITLCPTRSISLTDNNVVFQTSVLSTFVHIEADTKRNINSDGKDDNKIRDMMMGATLPPRRIFDYSQLEIFLSGNVYNVTAFSNEKLYLAMYDGNAFLASQFKIIVASTVFSIIGADVGKIVMHNELYGRARVLAMSTSGNVRNITSTGIENVTCSRFVRDPQWKDGPYRPGEFYPLGHPQIDDLLGQLPSNDSGSLKMMGVSIGGGLQKLGYGKITGSCRYPYPPTPTHELTESHELTLTPPLTRSPTQTLSAEPTATFYIPSAESVNDGAGEAATKSSLAVAALAAVALAGPATPLDAGRTLALLGTVSRCRKYRQALLALGPNATEKDVRLLREHFAFLFMSRKMSFPESYLPFVSFGGQYGQYLRGAVVGGYLSLLLLPLCGLLLGLKTARGEAMRRWRLRVEAEEERHGHGNGGEVHQQQQQPRSRFGAENIPRLLSMEYRQPEQEQRGRNNNSSNSSGGSRSRSSGAAAAAAAVVSSTDSSSGSSDNNRRNKNDPATSQRSSPRYLNPPPPRYDSLGRLKIPSLGELVSFSDILSNARLPYVFTMTVAVMLATWLGHASALLIAPQLAVAPESEHITGAERFFLGFLPIFGVWLVPGVCFCIYLQHAALSRAYERPDGGADGGRFLPWVKKPMPRKDAFQLEKLYVWFPRLKEAERRTILLGTHPNACLDWLMRAVQAIFNDRATSGRFFFNGDYVWSEGSTRDSVALGAPVGSFLKGCGGVLNKYMGPLSSAALEEYRKRQEQQQINEDVSRNHHHRFFSFGHGSSSSSDQRRKQPLRCLVSPYAVYIGSVWCAAAALAQSVSSLHPNRCSDVLAAMTAVCLLVWLTAMGLRPFLCPLRNLVSCLAEFITLLACCLAVGAFGATSDEAGIGLMGAAEVLFFVSIAVTLVGTFTFGLGKGLKVTQFWKPCTEAERRKMRLEDVEREEEVQEMTRMPPPRPWMEQVLPSSRARSSSGRRQHGDEARLTSVSSSSPHRQRDAQGGNSRHRRRQAEAAAAEENDLDRSPVLPYVPPPLPSQRRSLPASNNNNSSFRLYCSAEQRRWQSSPSSPSLSFERQQQRSPRSTNLANFSFDLSPRNSRPQQQQQRASPAGTPQHLTPPTRNNDNGEQQQQQQQSTGLRRTAPLIFARAPTGSLEEINRGSNRTRAEQEQRFHDL